MKNNNIEPETEIEKEIDKRPIINPEWELTPDEWPENMPAPKPKA